MSTALLHSRPHSLKYKNGVFCSWVNKENNVFKDGIGVKGLMFKLHGNNHSNHGKHYGNHHCNYHDNHGNHHSNDGNQHSNQGNHGNHHFNHHNHQL